MHCFNYENTSVETNVMLLIPLKKWWENWKKSDCC